MKHIQWNTNWKQTAKKCIAGVLTIALATGVCQSYGSIEASAQEMTLPGIQQLVQEKQTRGETFHILEIVADKSNASIGYLVGGEEPVSEGRKLSELPAASERIKVMQDLQNQTGTADFKDLIGNGPISRLDVYQEGNGSRTEDIRGSFVARGTEGRYNYVSGGSAYRMLQDTENPQGQTRYDRKSTVEPANDANATLQGVNPTFTEWTSSTPIMRVNNGAEVTEAYAADRYSLQYYNNEDGSMSIADPSAFVPDDYVDRNGRNVYRVVTNGNTTSYIYLGTIVKGANLPEGYAPASTSAAPVTNPGNSSAATGNGRSVSDSDAVSATSVSDNDPGIVVQNNDIGEDNSAANGIAMQSQEDISENLYIYNSAVTPATLWAKKVQDSYTFETITDGQFLHFTVDNTNGTHYISEVSCVPNADFRLSDVYTENTAGRYVKEGNGTTTVKVREIDADFTEQDTYDFIGDNSKSAFETVTYSGGFYNKEWFKKEVLNLSGSSRYEKDTDYSGEVNDFNIEVTTLTLEQLAELTAPDSQAYYGINLEDVDLIYLSGVGTYAAEAADMTSAATTLTKMIFGIKDTTGERNNADRVPVVMDYGFYSQNKKLGDEPNNNQNNKILTQMALTILKVSDDSIAKALASQGDAYWNSQTAISLSLDDSVKEALYDNVYLNDDSTTPYVASDYLTDWKGDAAKAATFGAVLKEIQYENFLAKKSDSNAAQMDEEISKASITRYILNWYLHRATVKSELNVLDLQPSYDFDKQGKVLTEEQVKTFMGMSDYSTESIHITHTTSAEFIGKIEDLNEKYDLIYMGDYIGGMNTETKNGKTTTKFNDTAMNGLIYYHVGDEYSYSKEASDDKARLRDDSLNHSENKYRGPGNDINSTRYEECKQYIDAGYPVILADQYVTTSGGYYVADFTRLDKNSYFYKLVQYALSTEQGQYKFWQKNVFTQSQLTGEVSGLGTELKDRRNVFCNYLNLSKLTMTWVEGLEASAYPTALSYGEDGQNTGYLKSESGDYILRYVFTLQNDSALSLTGTTYDCKLFVDRNADGRFSGSDYVPGKTTNTSEELTGLKVYVRNGSEWERLEQVQDASGNYGYALQTGKVYKLERTLPGDYVGVIPWKLVFYDNSDKLVRTAKSGYTAVPIGTKKIKILQIVSEDDNEWNLGQELENKSGLFYEYTKDLDGWEIEVDSRTVSQIMQELIDAANSRGEYGKYKAYQYGGDYHKLSEAWYQDAVTYMQKYNMLILGFADNYQFGNKTSQKCVEIWENNGIWGMENDESIAANIAFARAVRDYIEAGNSVLFTHDASSYVNSTSAIGYDWSWGYEFNKTIRAAVGLDRYGALKEYYSRMANSSNVSAEEKQRYLDYLKTLEGYDYDEIKQPGGDTELGQKEGLTRYTAVRFLRKQLNALNSSSETSFCFPIRNDLLRDAWYGNNKAKKKSKNALFGEYTNGDTESDKDNDNAGLANCMTASLVNEGQITQYPYQIGKTLSISNTHYQWLQPNMELDRDNDGKCDIVVWYCLGAVEGTTKDIYNILPNDVVNNYYIYNMGNVTYSGAGHSKPKSAAEAKLFINTMVAAYNAGISAPSVAFQDAQGNKISSTYMIYDPVNKMILKTENQGNTLSVRFRAEDNNVLMGEPQVCVEFYKSAEDGDTGVVEINGQKMVPLKSITVKDSAGNTVTATDGHYVVNNSSVYVLEYPLSEVGLFDDSSMTLKADAGAENIYAYVYTMYDNGRKTTAGSTAGLSVSAQELFDLN